MPEILKVGLEGGEDGVARACDVLRSGGLVVIPTDTVYGVAADGRLTGAEERLFLAKGRSREKRIPLLALGREAVEAFGARVGPVERQLADGFWPGPLTLVLRVGDRTEGFRVPGCGIARAILGAMGGVLRVTSANRSGERPSLTAEEAARALGGAVDLILDGGRSPGGRASTVVAVDEGRITILREGAIALEALSGMGHVVRRAWE